MENIHTPILIIGAGPAGLATAARLSAAGQDFTIIEKSKYVGNAWREHYDRLCLHTVKELSHLPLLPFPDDYPRYVHKDQLVDYYEQYKDHFKIKPHYETAATDIRRKNGEWQVQTDTGQTFQTPNLVVATGVNHAPNRPVFKDEEQFTGQIIHSKVYKNGKPFVGKNVLVVGMGNTGAEVALDLVEYGAASTTIAVRGKVNIVPRDLRGRPTQLTALKLAKLPTWLGDWLGSQVRKLTMGDLPKYNLPYPKIPPAKQLRTLGKTPVVDLGTADMIRAGKIKIVNTGIDHFTPGSVIFEDGSEQAFDVVILATGYKANLTDMIEHGPTMMDRFGWPKFVVGAGEQDGLYFIGFDNYTAGGILGVINRDSQIIAEHISQKLIPA
ncbi:MAG: NAD(P)/FAD-dependent oxidoreductase [Bacteroidota bacterium]